MPPSTVTTEVRICALDDVDEEEGLRVELPGQPPLAVWRVGDTPYVTDDTCTHGQASLTRDGMLDDFVIECGLHQGAFDIRDGSIDSAPCTVPLRVYAAFLKEGIVYAELPGEAK